MKKKFTLTVLCMVFSGCGGSPDAPTIDLSKDLFSSWTEDGSTTALDLTEFSFGTSPAKITHKGDNAICDCTSVIGGTQSNGSFVVENCVYRVGTGNGSDPGCSSINASYTYTKTDVVLTLCSAGTCHTYH